MRDSRFIIVTKQDTMAVRVISSISVGNCLDTTYTSQKITKLSFTSLIEDSSAQKAFCKDLNDLLITKLRMPGKALQPTMFSQSGGIDLRMGSDVDFRKGSIIARSPSSFMDAAQIAGRASADLMNPAHAYNVDDIFMVADLQSDGDSSSCTMMLLEILFSIASSGKEVIRPIPLGRHHCSMTPVDARRKGDMFIVLLTLKIFRNSVVLKFLDTLRDSKETRVIFVALDRVDYDNLDYHTMQKTRIDS